jgi:hypothetical protein
MITDEQLQTLRRRAHQHTSSCYGRYEPCGEHHAHDDKCGGRSRVCGQREEPELVMLLDEINSLRASYRERERLHEVSKAAKELSCKLARCGAVADIRWYSAELTSLDAVLAALAGKPQ